MQDSFGIRDTLNVGGKSYQFANFAKLDKKYNVARLPYPMKVLLENLLRREDGVEVTHAQIEAVLNWDPKAEAATEIPFLPARVLLQDFTGVPSIVDLAAMRDAMVALGGDPTRINPQSPCELVIDHSVQVDVFGQADAPARNAEIEFKRNYERYAFLRWGQKALKNFRVVPPDTGIVHQVNLEYLARVVMTSEIDGATFAYPDTLFGTDSHTTMVNGLGVLGWGVGGIEAEAAMLGQAASMLIPQVVGFRFTGALPDGATATDLVLTVAQMLRKHGVVGKFVQFFGPGMQHLALATRATLGNMSPEYGATCAISALDQESLTYLHLSGRDPGRIALIEAYAKAQGMWHDANTPDPEFSSVLELDLADVKPSLAGPKRPQDRVLLTDMRKSYQSTMQALSTVKKPATDSAKERFLDEGGSTAVGRKQSQAEPSPGVCAPGEHCDLEDGSVVIAAITSCTNTSNPAVMIGAGLLAKRAAERGLKPKAWVKTSLAPGSKVVTDYLDATGLTPYLEQLGFYLVGYGCTTCIGNSGPLPEDVSRRVDEKNLAVAAVLSGNRNFEGRIHAQTKMNYLASPPLVVAFAIAGTVDIDLATQPLGKDKAGKDVYLKDIWPSNKEIADLVAKSINSGMFKKTYGAVFQGNDDWNSIKVPEGDQYAWSGKSTYIKNPPYFDGMTMAIPTHADIANARCIGLFGDSVTTDHISPAGAIKKDSPAGKYLMEHGVEPKNFNSYGSRRGNDDVMVRGTFANIRIKNRLLDGVEGGYTLHIPSGQQMTIYDAAMKYQAEKTPLIVIAGKEYGTGSSRDWAAKGTLLLGIGAVIAESFERIHRSNLVGMGVLPLQFKDGENAQTLGLTGKETYAITGLNDGDAKLVHVTATDKDGKKKAFDVRVMLLTPKERAFYKHGGILQYVLRDLAKKAA
ncbi:MAG: aconitate hydratase AcnA [Rhodanobacteraceae bacterium]|nr:MAG: aconitate hydratase AcnA [Rhodanobacteraceae bacterium]